jgi:hypothetical protein
MNVNLNPEWIARGKSIAQLIKELQTFTDPEMEVRISVDDGKTFHAISLVGRHFVKVEKPNFVYFCGLTNCEGGLTPRSPENFAAAKKVDVGKDYE